MMAGLIGPCSHRQHYDLLLPTEGPSVAGEHELMQPGCETPP
jgi:hypothetical protein